MAKENKYLKGVPRFGEVLRLYRRQASKAITFLKTFWGNLTSFQKVIAIGIFVVATALLANVYLEEQQRQLSNCRDLLERVSSRDVDYMRSNNPEAYNKWVDCFNRVYGTSLTKINPFTGNNTNPFEKYIVK